MKQDVKPIGVYIAIACFCCRYAYITFTLKYIYTHLFVVGYQRECNNSFLSLVGMQCRSSVTPSVCRYNADTVSK